MRRFTHYLLTVLAALVLTLGIGEAARAEFLVGAFGSSRSDRPFSGSDYRNLRARLLDPANFGPGGIVNERVLFAPDIGIATADTLRGLDVFIISEVERNPLSGAEVSALRNFVLGGGSLVLVTDSGPGMNNGAHLMLQALTGGSALGFGGDSGGMVGRILGSGAAVNGPFGNLFGLDFAATPGAQIRPGAEGGVIGQTDRGLFDILAEIPAGALGPGSGGVLAAGDVLFMDFFVPPASLFNNVNNALLFQNFLAGSRGDPAIPEPASLTLLCVGGATLLGYGWRRRQAQAVA